MTGWGWACCPDCGEPLVSTLEFRKKEFICVPEQRLWEFLEPVGKPETPELVARHDELREQYKGQRKVREEAGTLGVL